MLAAAWNLAQKYLIVGLLSGKAKESVYRFNDGIITQWSTFEKHYSATSLEKLSFKGLLASTIAPGAIAITVVDGDRTFLTVRSDYPTRSPAAIQNT